MLAAHKIEQRTLRQAISFVGVGLHSGRMTRLTLRPNQDSNGILFQRSDVENGRGLIAARWYNVSDTRLSTTISNEYGVSVATIEHLMAALAGCGVDNALIDIDGPEVPIMDGSAEPFATSIEKYGTLSLKVPRNAIWIQQPIEVRDGDKHALLLPARKPRITLSIDFPDTLIGAQVYSIELVNEAFVQQLARSRTFGFAQQVEALRDQGLALGGSLNNAILVDGDRIINRGGLRYADEFVRHKVLDAYGDLALAGVPIIGHYYGHKSGHALNKRLMEKLFESHSSWSYVTLGEYEKMMGVSLHEGARKTSTSRDDAPDDQRVAGHSR
ncbi:MAG: UDP-3-O-acyl-N-acetylglucosamine deacetylase [Candidatus Thiodiazotropha sp.]